MIKKLIKDMFRQYTYSISEDLTSQQLGEYYLLFDEERIRKGKDQANIKHFDSGGIPYYNRTFEYYPISVGQMGLAVWHTYLKTKSVIDKYRFMAFAEFFLNAMDEDGVIWNDTPLMHWSKSWKSSFAQSRAISVLLRAFQLTGMEIYKDGAKKALIAMYEWNNGFFKEYPNQYLLDGHIFSMLGIYDYLRVFPNSKNAKNLWDKGLKVLIDWLPIYDLGYWSGYGITGEPSAKTYQLLHIVLMDLMHKITLKPLFGVYHMTFSLQLTFKNLMKAYWNKWRHLKKY